ncbi:MAG: ferritin [Desulfobacterales bacterium]|jgi:ferritin|nr:ferritin [Desulfobacteraceae bacterium]MBT7085359.1 ferritin [Desulfobacterales bacterium]MBT7696681.1 ferritin [Desulfobacterales bacterium]
MINERMLTAINEQIKNELESSYLYLSMTAYFHSESLDGMAHWMRCQTNEEIVHAMKFYNFIIDRGAQVKLLNLSQLKTNWASPIEAWKDAYKHEQQITGNINDLITIAREEKEYASEPLLAWFVEEQIEEEANVSKVVEQLEILENDKPGLLMLDRELGGRAFLQGSPFDPLSIKNA